MKYRSNIPFVRAATGDVVPVNATLETMVPEPYVHCVAVMTGGVGGHEVRRFYSQHFINQIPKDAQVTPISRTIGKDQVVDEFILSFHNDAFGSEE
jgi:carboxymethylenebutenolidase